MTTEQSSTVAPTGGETGQDPHRSLHSEAGGLPGEHPGRSDSPLVKVAGLAWLVFEKPDLDRAGRFLADFGGDVLTATIASADGALDLGTQRHTMIGKTP